MAIPENISKDDILKAIKFIDENGIPESSTMKIRYYLRNRH